MTDKTTHISDSNHSIDTILTLCGKEVNKTYKTTAENATCAHCKEVYKEVFQLHGYKCFFNSESCDVFAKSSYAAQQKAIEHFKVKKSKQHLVHVHLCENTDGSQVVQSTDF